MQNDEIKKNHKKNQGMFFESIWLTQLTCHAQYGTRIKKNWLSKEEPSKKRPKLNKKRYWERKYKLTRANLTNPHSR